ncbi:MAG: ABC transporter permease subunit, partial [Pseudodesulfovibrio sp.]
MKAWRAAGYGAAALFLLLWQAGTVAGLLPANHLSPPLDAARALLDNAPLCLAATAATVGRTLGAFTLGSLAGLALGLGHGLSPLLRRATGPLIEGLRPLPSAALIPAAILLCGMGATLNVAVAAFACAWPAFVAARDGVAGAPSLLIDTARTLGVGRRRLLADVILPCVLPPVVSGLRIGLAVAFAVEISVEMIVPRSGLGALAATAALAARTPLLYAAMGAAALAGFALNHG